MKLRNALLGLAMSAALLPAMAADQAIDLSSGYASFGSTVPLLQGGDDVITFTNLAAGSYNYAVSITGQYITDLAGTLNGSPLAMSSFGVFRFGGLQGATGTPIVLTLTGTTITSPLASYSVTMSATPVPEPGTYAMLLAGLGVVALLARRRRSD